MDPGTRHVPMTARVRLRDWRSADAVAIAIMAADPHLRRWSSMGGDVAGWIERQRAAERGPSRAICLADDDRALGKVALRLPGRASPATRCEAIEPDDQPAGELSYWLVPAARGRGLALAAVRLMLGSIGPAAAMRSVVLDVEVENAASLRLAERLGAERRTPERVEVDRTGTPRRLAVFVLAV